MRRLLLVILFAAGVTIIVQSVFVGPAGSGAYAEDGGLSHAPTFVVDTFRSRAGGVPSQEASTLRSGGLPSVSSPFALETEGAAASAVSTEPTAGQTIYRVYGGDSTAGDASWSPVNPGDVAEFRDAAGLPSGGASSTCQFVIEGTLNDPAAVVLQRNALALDGLKGGLPEYIIPNCMGNGSVGGREILPVDGHGIPR